MALAMKLPSGVGRAEDVGHWDALAGHATNLRDAAGMYVQLHTAGFATGKCKHVSAQF